MDRIKKLELIGINDTHFEIRDHQNQVCFEYEYIPEHKLVIHKWSEYLAEGDIVDVYKLMGPFAKERLQFAKISISDLEKYEGSFHLSNEWVAKFYIPKSIQVGYRYAFFVESKDFFTKLALEDSIEGLKEIGGLTEIRVFESLEEAITYAKSL